MREAPLRRPTIARAVGLNVGFWGSLPAGILLTFFIAGIRGLSRYGR